MQMSVHVMLGEESRYICVRLNRVNLEVDVLAKYMERSVAANNEELRAMVAKLEARVAELEKTLAESRR